MFVQTSNVVSASVLHLLTNFVIAERLGWTVKQLQGSPAHSVDSDYTELFDVNADGLPDVVSMLPGVYGGCHGLWLQGKGGAEDGFGAMEGMGVQGALGSQLSLYNANVLSLDIDGDGTADLVHMASQGQYVVYSPMYGPSGWLWMGRSIEPKPGLEPKLNLGADAKRTKVFDVNGDGLVDVVWGEGHNYRYLDLAGGRRPWLLKRIDGGMGKTTEISWETSVQQMLRAAREGHPWTRTAPTVQQVVAQVTVNDNLDKYGVNRPAGKYVTK